MTEGQPTVHVHTVTNTQMWCKIYVHTVLYIAVYKVEHKVLW